MSLPADDELITLKEASEIVFRGRVSPETLKVQWRKGNLDLSKIGRSYFGAVADFKGLKTKCLADPQAPDSGTTKHAKAGQSSTDESASAQASALKKLQERKKALGITSRRSTQ